MNLPTLRRPAAAPARYRLARPALTAAAKSGNPDRNQPRQRLRRLHQDWQLRALATYDTVGECWYPSQFYGRSLAKTRWFPAVLNDKGEPEEQESGKLADLFARIHDPGSAGMSELAASYGRLQFLNGDGYLTVSEDGEDGEAWEYLSVAELRIDPGGRDGEPQRYRRLRGPGLAPEELSEAPDTEFTELKGTDVRVSRLWRSHPAHSQLADAPIRAVLDLYELLHRLTLAAAAEALSRAAQRGLLVIAEELTQHFQRGPDDDPDSDPFLTAFGEALTNAIENPGDASAASPILLRGPGVIPGATGNSIPIKDLVAWLQIGPADRYLEGEMWDKTIGRIGNGLDLPREFITGVEKANHWTGWLIDEQGYRQHISPVSERFGSDIASAYLRPAAKAAGFPGWERVVVGYDPAEAILHPDKVQTAFDAHDRLLVSDAYVLDAIGAGDEDAPTDEELNRRIMILLHKDPYAPADQQGETSPTDGGTGGDTVKAPPSSTDSGNATSPDSGSPGVQVASAANGHAQNGAVTAAALQAARIVGLAEMQVERARELAGARLVRRSQKCAPCRDKIREVQATLVASTLGRDMVREVIDGHTSEVELVGGVGAALANKLRTWGIRGDWPDQLGVLVEQHALRTLYEESPPPLPSAFAAAVAKALR